MPDRYGTRSARAPTDVPGRDELYRLLVENVTDYAIFMLDPEGRVATWTEGAGRLTGYGEDEALGEHVSLIYPAEDVASGTPGRDLETAARDGRCEAMAWRVRRDGTRFWVSSVMTAIMGDDGRLVGFGLVTRDLTDRKEVADRYEESRQRYRSLVEHNPSAVCSFDMTGRLVAVNPATLQVTGFAEDELLSLWFWDIVVSGDRGRMRALFQRAVTGDPQYAETAIAHRSGRRVDLSVTLVPTVVHGQLIGVHCIAEDISPRKRAEAEREAALLRERLARAEAEAANQAKSDFLAVVSHELKTPLNVITGYADLLADGEAGPVSEIQRRHLGRVQASARQLLQLIEEVLDYARMEAGREGVRLERVDVPPLLREAAAEAEEAAREKGLAFRLETDGARWVVETDPAKLRQALRLLLSNAVKFTERGEVRLGAARDGGTAVFSVRDTGVGIPPSHLPLIWEPFRQGEDPLRRRKGGAGLGLGTVRRLARLLGGDTAVESIEGVGSTFTVRIPVSFSAPE